MYEGRWRHIGDTYVQLGMLQSDFKLDKFIYSKENYKPKHNILFYFLIGIIIVFIIHILLIFSFGFRYSKIRPKIEKDDE